MKKFFGFVFLGFFIFTLSFPSIGDAKKKKSKKIREGTCTEVIDAAHIVVSDGKKELKIKLLGIETLDDVVFPTYSKQATDFLNSLIGGTKIILEYPSGTARDKKGYMSAMVYSSNILMNASILEEGQGFYSGSGLSDRHAKRLSEAEDKGKKEKRGFWGDGSPTTTAEQMNDFMARQMNSNMGMFMNQNMQQMLPAVNKDK